MTVRYNVMSIPQAVTKQAGTITTIGCLWCDDWSVRDDSDEHRIELAQHQVSAHRNEVFGYNPSAT